MYLVSIIIEGEELTVSGRDAWRFFSLDSGFAPLGQELSKHPLGSWREEFNYSYLHEDKTENMKDAFSESNFFAME